MAEAGFMIISLQSLRVLKTFGFAAFTVENKKSFTKFSDLSHFASCLATGIIFLMISIKYRCEFTSSSSEIANVGNFITYVTSIIIALMSMIITFLFRHKIWETILKLSEADEIFKTIGVFLDTTRIAKYILAIVLFIMSLSIPLQICNYFIEGSLLKVICTFILDYT